MNHLSLDELVGNLPRVKGKYIVHIDNSVKNEALSYFEYDIHRTPQHPHFIEYGKNFFDLDYIGHYLLPSIETRVMRSHETTDLILQYEIK